MARPKLETITTNQRAIDLHREVASTQYSLEWLIWFIDEWEKAVKAIRGNK